MIWIGVAVLAVAYATWLSAQVDVAREQATAAQLREQQLVAQLQQLVAQAPAPCEIAPEPISD